MAHPTVLAETKDSKKVIKAYNRTAVALMEFEALWQAAWVKGVDSAVGPLNAPLLVRVPATGHLLVNLDLSVMQLIRESQWMGRIGIPLPEKSRLLLLRAGTLQKQFDGLTGAIRDLERVKTVTEKAVLPLMQPHLDNIYQRAQVPCFLTFLTVVY